MLVPPDRLPELSPRLVIAQKYQLVARIGRGAYAEVFEARHVSTRQPAALKILSRSQDFESLRRFLIEAQSMAVLESPNTVRIHDFGQDDAGFVYLAMELLRGRTLRAEHDQRRLRNASFSEGEIVDLALSILLSLEEAHARGLVHRDLKPDNVFLHAGADRRALVKVCDFGVVKVLEGGLTTDGVPRGTPAYMSPEQALPGAELDGRSDLYALGVMMFELAAGVRPFGADNALQLQVLHAQQPAPPLPGHLASEGLRSIVARALAKRPEDRFSGARAMREAIEALGIVRLPIPVELGTTATVTQDPREAALQSVTATPAASAPIRLEPVPGRSGRVVGLASAAVLIAAGWVWSRERPPPPAPEPQLSPAPTVLATANATTSATPPPQATAEPLAAPSPPSAPAPEPRARDTRVRSRAEPARPFPTER